MKIWSQSEDGSMCLAARCDRCHHTVSASGREDSIDEIQEFVHIEVSAGPGAAHFTKGDVLVADLCERCAHELLAPCLRRVQSASGEIDFPFIKIDELFGQDSDDDGPPSADLH